MVKVAAIIWVLAGTVLAGAFVTLVLCSPSLSAQAARLIAWAGVGGYVVAIPIAAVLAKKIMGATANA
jgi:hypothetical protein